jgi:hypothetical protein
MIAGTFLMGGLTSIGSPVRAAFPHSEFPPPEQSEEAIREIGTLSVPELFSRRICWREYPNRREFWDAIDSGDIEAVRALFEILPESDRQDC